MAAGHVDWTLGAGARNPKTTTERGEYSAVPERRRSVHGVKPSNDKAAVCLETLEITAPVMVLVQALVGKGLYSICIGHGTALTG